MDSTNTPYLVNRGWVKFALSDFDGAVADGARAIELNPNNADGYILRGEARRLLEKIRRRHRRLHPGHRQGPQKRPGLVVSRAGQGKSQRRLTAPLPTVPRPSNWIPKALRPMKISACSRTISRNSSRPWKTSARPCNWIPGWSIPASASGSSVPGWVNRRPPPGNWPAT